MAVTFFPTCSSYNYFDARYLMTPSDRHSLLGHGLSFQSDRQGFESLVVLQKIEAPVRDTIPDQGKPVEERNTNELAPGLKGSEALKPFDSDISADDAMR